MNKGLLIGGAVVAVAALAGAGAMGFVGGPKQVEPAYVAAQEQAQTGATPVASTGETKEQLAPMGAYSGTVTDSGGFTGDVLEGDPDAPVTIIEYASLTCPHCASFHEQTYKQLKAEYIDTGKVKFIYRDFPLNNPAIAASIIARCAGEDKYLAFVDLFLTQQDRWTRAQDWMGELQNMAKLGGLGTERINTCLGDKALGQNVIDRYRAASEVFEVNSTPTIIIDGKTHTGGRDFAAIAKVIDGKL